MVYIGNVIIVGLRIYQILKPLGMCNTYAEGAKKFQLVQDFPLCKIYFIEIRFFSENH